MRISGRISGNTLMAWTTALPMVCKGSKPAAKRRVTLPLASGTTLWIVFSQALWLPRAMWQVSKLSANTRAHWR
jgi:hypothetical protein